MNKTKTSVLVQKSDAPSVQAGGSWLRKRYDCIQPPDIHTARSEYRHAMCWSQELHIPAACPECTACDTGTHKYGKTRLQPWIKGHSTYLCDTRCKVTMIHGAHRSVAQIQWHANCLPRPVSDWEAIWARKTRRGQERENVAITAQLVHCEASQNEICPARTVLPPATTTSQRMGTFMNGWSGESRTLRQPRGDRESWGSKHSQRLTLQCLFTPAENQPVGPRGRTLWQWLWLLLVLKQHFVGKVSRWEQPLISVTFSM